MVSQAAGCARSCVACVAAASATGDHASFAVCGKDGERTHRMVAVTCCASNGLVRFAHSAQCVEAGITIQTRVLIDGHILNLGQSSNAILPPCGFPVNDLARLDGRGVTQPV
jgi:hypothetical protein